jgi:hypothetical protein
MQRDEPSLNFAFRFVARATDAPQAKATSAIASSGPALPCRN